MSNFDETVVKFCLKWSMTGRSRTDKRDNVQNSPGSSLFLSLSSPSALPSLLARPRFSLERLDVLVFYGCAGVTERLIDWFVVSYLFLRCPSQSEPVGTTISFWHLSAAESVVLALKDTVLQTAGRRTARSLQINTVGSHAKPLSGGARLSLRSWEECLNHFDVWCFALLLLTVLQAAGSARRILLHYWGKGLTFMAFFIVNVLKMLIKA